MGVIKGDIEHSYQWKSQLELLGFSEKPVGNLPSYYVMEEDGFEVEFSTGCLWEVRGGEHSSISNINELSHRYMAKTGEPLSIPT